jgi:hypothetical protein
VQCGTANFAALQFGGGDNSILNNGRFNLRHFADTNGDGVPDTLRVAIAVPVR